MEVSNIASELHALFDQHIANKAPAHLAFTSKAVWEVHVENGIDGSYLPQFRSWPTNMIRRSIIMLDTLPQTVEANVLLSGMEKDLAVVEAVRLFDLACCQLVQVIWNGGHGVRQKLPEKIEMAASAFLEGLDKAQAELPYPVVDVRLHTIYCDLMKLIGFAANIGRYRHAGPGPGVVTPFVQEASFALFGAIGYLAGALGCSVKSFDEARQNIRKADEEDKQHV